MGTCMDGTLHVAAQQLDAETHVIEAHGEIDASNAADLRHALDAAAERRAGRVILDLAEVSFVDARGLRVMLGAQKRFEAEGTTMLTVCTHPLVRRVFELTGVSGVLGVTSSRPA